METATNIRKGQVLVVDDELWVVLDCLHKTPGNLRGFVQVTLRNVRSGRKDNRRFRSTDKVEKAFIETRDVTYLYRDHAGLHVMDAESYEQTALDVEMAGDAVNYLREGETVKAQYHDGALLGFDLPSSVTLTVTDCEPGVKGDSVSNVFKPATLETGLVVKVPNHINEGDEVRVDTRTGEFQERA